MSAAAASAAVSTVSDRRDDQIPARVWNRLGVIYLGLGAGAWFAAQEAGYEDWWLHGLWCFVGLAVALPTLSVALLRGFTVVLTDHRLMFLAAFALYFLFGASLLAVGPELQIQSNMGVYHLGAGEALQADAINGLGFGLAMLTATLARGRWLGLQAGRIAARAGRMPAHWAIRLFLTVGVAATLYVLPFDLGMVDGMVSGTVRGASKFSMVAIYLSSAHRGPGERESRLFGIIVAVLSAVVGALTFSKSAVLMPLAALVAGLAMRFGSRRILLPGLSVVVVLYLTLGSLTDYGRLVLLQQGTATPTQRWQYLQEGWTRSRELRDDDDEYGYWSRLCYVPPQTAALALYDAGEGGDGLTLALWVLVPRVLFPEKPEITKTGREFNMKVTGSDTSATGLGIFASGYYHGGWWVFAFASILCGWILAQTSAIARAIDVNHGLLMLPFSLLGLLTAFRIDGDFVADYLGTFIFILYPLLAATLLLSAGRSRPFASGRRESP